MAAPAPSQPRLPVGSVTPEAFAPIARRIAREGPRWRRILGIAWPVVLANLLQSLALTVDLVFVGFLGAGALAAAGLASQIYFLALAAGTGLAAAATALVARAYGAGDLEGADRATWIVGLLALAVGLALTFVMVGFAHPLVALAAAGDATVRDDAATFMAVLAAGLPANIVVAALTGAFQGAGDTRPTLLVGLAVNVVNVILDAVLIFGAGPFPEMGLQGAAVATAVANVAGAILMIGVLLWGRRPLRLRATRPRRDDLARVLRIGAPAGAEAFLLSVGFTAYLILILQFGAPALAAHSIGLRVQSFAFLPGFGFATAAGALVGQALGAGDSRRAEQDGWSATTLGLLVMVGASIPLVLFARPIAGVFTSDAEALDLGATWIRALVLAMPAIAVHFTVAGALRGAGDTRWPLLVSFVGLWVVRLPLAWVLAVPFGLGMIGVWAAYIVEYYGRALVTAWRFRAGAWKALRV